MNDILENGNIRLRAAEPSDLDFLFMLEREVADSSTTLSGGPVTRHMLWEYLQNYRADLYAERQIRFIIEDITLGKAVGTVDISDYEPHSRRGFAGLAILRSERRRGYGYEALELLCGFARHAGLHQLAAIISRENEASTGVFLKAGFKSCGMFRSWIRDGNRYVDGLLFQRLFE